MIILWAVDGRYGCASVFPSLIEVQLLQTGWISTVQRRALKKPERHPQPRLLIFPIFMEPETKESTGEPSFGGEKFLEKHEEPITQ